MPAQSYAQLRYIYAQRNKYKNKSKTPEHMQWIWEDAWTHLKPGAKKN